MELLSQLSNCLKSDNALGTSFQKSSKPILPTLVAVWLTTFIVTVLLGYWFLRLIWSQGNGSGIRISENTARLIVLTNFQLFFLNKFFFFFLNCCKTLVNFENSETLTLVTFFLVLQLLWRSWDLEILTLLLHKCFLYSHFTSF